MSSILVLNGPNLNLLGQREPDIYGHDTIDTINKQLQSTASQRGHSLDCMQSNAEHALIDRVHKCTSDKTEFLIINPGAFTHTSIALRDAILSIAIPCIEVHLSNVYKREAFRQKSYFSDIALGVISGFGAYGYQMALNAAFQHLE